MPAEISFCETRSTNAPTYMVLIVKTISQMDALVPVFSVIARQSRKYSQLDARCITILLHRSDDLDGTFCLLLAIIGFHHFAKCSLAKELGNPVWSPYISLPVPE